LITTLAFIAYGLGCYGVGMIIGYVIGRAKGYAKGRADYQSVVGRF